MDTKKPTVEPIVTEPRDEPAHFAAEREIVRPKLPRVTAGIKAGPNRRK